MKTNLPAISGLSSAAQARVVLYQSGTLLHAPLTGVQLSPIAGSSSITTVGALDSGSITSGFGSIDIGASTFATSGAASTGTLTVTDAASGNVLIVRQTASGGTPSNTHGEIVVDSNEANIGIQILGTTTSNQKLLFSDTAATSGQIEYNHTSDYMAFYTATTQRALFSNQGHFLVAKTAVSTGAVGHELRSTGEAVFTANGLAPLTINRLTSDGALVNFYQATTLEGSISVSGTTVSYGSFSGYHWSQLTDNSKPAIKRGTIVESIDEMCSWPGEENDQLAKFKISDTAESRSVYGVFMRWDEDDGGSSDAMIVALGAYLVRISASETVVVGDLIESNGDGTGRVQTDNIFRSSTVAKVTSSNVVETYADGSYLVPCTLHCG